MIGVVLATFFTVALCSSHSEAPGTSKSPRSDLSDVYLFRSPSNNDYVTMIANLSPLQQSQAGPNYSPVDDNFVYQLHFDNDGDAHEDFTFQFLFGSRYHSSNSAQGLQIEGRAIPLVAFGQYNPDKPTSQDEFLNVQEYYRVRMMRGEDYITHLDEGDFLTSDEERDNGSNDKFTKAFEYSGTKTFGKSPTGVTNTPDQNYDDYVTKNAVYNRIVNIPGCAHKASLFVGPRRESFALPLGRTFDLLNFGTGGQDAALNSLDRLGVIEIALEVHQDCILDGNTEKIIGAWASVRELHHVGPAEDKHAVGHQVSRLANPLVNELIIGLPDKDKWSSSHPSDDLQFVDYFRAPAISVQLEALGVGKAPTHVRNDLVAGLMQGVNLAGVGVNLNKPTNTAFRKRVVGGAPGQPRVEYNLGHDDDDDSSSTSTGTSSQSRSYDSFEAPRVPLKKLPPTVAGTATVWADIMRLNLGIPAKARVDQSPLGVAGLDLQGYPNGRRVGDDVVDITVRVAQGLLCQEVPLDTLGLVGKKLNEAVGVCGPSDAKTPLADFAKLTDRVPIHACDYPKAFPYLNRPVPGNVPFSTAVPTQNNDANKLPANCV